VDLADILGGVVRFARSALVILALLGSTLAACDDDESEAAPEFTAAAAEEALRGFYTASSAKEFCGYLLPLAERQILAVIREQERTNTDGCEAAMDAAARGRGPFTASQELSREERDTLSGAPTLNEEDQTASFLDRFHQGIVLRLVDGRWLVAGVATGG
jgi:hypothetical protein